MGIEPTSAGATIRCVNHFATTAINEKERVMGIEPTRPAWKAGVLPLNYTRTILLLFIVANYSRKKTKMVGKTGFEPATSWSRTKRSTKLSHFPMQNESCLSQKAIRSTEVPPLAGGINGVP